MAEWPAITAQVMIQVGTSSRQLVVTHNLDQSCPSVVVSEETTTRVMAATVVQAAVVRIRVALPEQVLQAKETQAETQLVVEVVQQAAVAVAPVVWVLQETLLKDKVDQESQLQSPDLPCLTQAVAAAVVGQLMLQRLVQITVVQAVVALVLLVVETAQQMLLQILAVAVAELLLVVMEMEEAVVPEL